MANKEKKELTKRLKKEEEKFDHFVRACHENEIPLVEKLSEEDALARKKFWEQKEVERIENLKQEQLVQSENRERLLRMVADKEKFEKIIHAARREEFEKKMVEFEAKLVAARETKLAERKEKRKQDRRAAFLKEIEDRKRREEDERNKRDDEERRKKLAEQAEKQRQREREIEEKLNRQQQAKQETEEKPPQAAEPPANVYRPRGAGGAGFGAKAANIEKTIDNESPWRRNNADESSGSSRQEGGADKFNYTRGGGNRGGDARDAKTDGWRSSGGADQRRIGGGDDESRGGRGGYGAGRAERGAPASGDRGGYNRPERGGRTSGTNRGFGADGNKADSADSWRRPDQN